LKDKKEDMNVRELFKTRFENSEVIPGDSVRNALLRKLAIREFFHFIPSRFNIYYLGGLVAAATVAVLIIGTDRPVKILSVQNPSSPIENVSEVASGNPSEETRASQENSKQKIEVKNTSSSKHEALRNNIHSADNKPFIRNADSTVINPDSLKKRPILNEYLPERNKPVGIQKKIGASFDVSVSGGCAPLKIKFINKSVSFDSCRWTFGDGGYSNEKNPVWIFDLEGEYRIVLRVFSSDGFQAEATTSIIVHSRPVSRFEISPEKAIIPDDEIRFINYSDNAVRYKWEFGDGSYSNAVEPYHKYKKYGAYNVRLIAWSEYGCTDSILVKNAFTGTGCFINFPNAFIPGTDGPAGGYYSSKSDESARIFHPVTSGVAEFHMKIFSKLGILIFESNDINWGWDGYFKGQLCEPGVYIWKVRGTYKNGEPFVKMGDVTILRN
jgi:PKD repeat protein